MSFCFIDNEIIKASLITFVVAIIIFIARRGLNPDINKDEHKAPVSYDKQSCREILFHIDNIAHNRINFYFVAESIFFAVVATLWHKNPNEARLVAYLGLIFTFFLWYSIARMDRALSWIADVVESKDDFYKYYRNQGPPKDNQNIPQKKRYLGILSSFFHFTWTLPAITFYVWFLIIQRL